MSKILVTGGAGFIGSSLVDRLIGEGEDVVIIDNLYSGKESYLNPSAKFYNIDICDDGLEAIFSKEKFDYVFHLAAQIDVRKSVEDMVLDNEINILGSINVLKNCQTFAVKKIVFASSGGAAYGFPEIIPTPETYPTNPISPYGINKLSFEKYLNYFHKVFKQDYVALRLSNVYGPRQYKGGEAGVVAIFSSNAVLNKKSYINGDGLQTRDYTYIDDIVSAFILSIKSDYVGVLNIGTGIEKNLLDIVVSIEKSLGHKIDVEHQEAKLGEERRSALDNSLAKKSLSWEPEISLEEGIKRTIEWTKNSLN